MNTPVQNPAQAAPQQPQTQPSASVGQGADFMADLEPKVIGVAGSVGQMSQEPEDDASVFDDITSPSLEDLMPDPENEVSVKSTSDFIVRFLKPESGKKLKGSTDASKCIVGAEFAFTRSDEPAVEAPKRPGRKPANPPAAAKQPLVIRMGDDYENVATNFVDYLHSYGEFTVEIQVPNQYNSVVETFEFSGCTIEDQPTLMVFSETEMPQPRVLALHIQFEDVVRESVKAE